jgi:hypothetical protein
MPLPVGQVPTHHPNDYSIGAVGPMTMGGGLVWLAVFGLWPSEMIMFVTSLY